MPDWSEVPSYPDDITSPGWWVNLPDDVLPSPSVAAFPSSGTPGKLYVATDTNTIYLWTGTAYAKVSGRATSDDITDSGPTGRSLVRSADQPAAWSALGTIPVGNLSAAGIAQYRPIVDLRDWDAIRNGKWKTSLGVRYTSGQSTLTGTITPFTAADVGNVIVLNSDSGTKWIANIVSVSAGVATIDIPAPETVSSYGQRAIWGPDITTDLNAALQQIAAVGYPVAQASLSGLYRATQIVLPDYVTLRGSGWGDYTGGPLQHSGLRLWQLPGSEKDFVVFGPTNPASGSFFGPVGLSDVNLQGPESVTNRSRTVGSGLSFCNSSGVTLIAQDGVELARIHISDFPEHGMKANGAVPLTIDTCRTWYNGGYGIDFQPSLGSSVQVQMLHLLNYSADGNNLGAARFKDCPEYGSILITALKSEWGSYDTYGSPGYQKNCLVFEDCDNTAVTINGLTHIAGYPYGSQGAGPAITIKSATSKRPRIVFSGVTNRITGAETGDTTAAVTIRDQVSSVDVPRTVVNGFYPDGAAGHTCQTVTTTTTLGYFEDHTVFIGSGGAPTLPSAARRPGARCKLVNTSTGDVSVVLDGGIVALLKADDQADGATTITDSSLLAANWTANGNAQIDTAITKYGAGAILLDSGSCYITPSADTSNFAFGTDDFTIEFWVRLGSALNAQYLLDFRPDGTYSGAYPTLIWNSSSSNALTYFTQGNFQITGPALSATTWYHVAVCRAAGKTRLFLNGSQVGSTYADTNNYLCPSGRPWIGGNSYNTSGWVGGSLDDIRITRSALYITDFTPPAALMAPRVKTISAGQSLSVESDGTAWTVTDMPRHTSETVTTTTTLGYFEDHTVFIGSGGAPTLPSAAHLPGARCRFINTTTGQRSVVIDGTAVELDPDAAIQVESDGTVWRKY